MDHPLVQRAWDLPSWVLALSVAVVFIVPFLLHLYLYRSAESSNLPSFLLIGPSTAGKTSFATLCKGGPPKETHTSQSTDTIEVSLPVDTKTGSSRYRSEEDPANDFHKSFLLIDTPGHGKLRHAALQKLNVSGNTKGIIFMVDSSNLTVGGASVGGEAGGGLRETAQYLYDVLLHLQALARTSKLKKRLPILIAANKSDLFTALPPTLVKDVLESELTVLRDSRSADLMDSGKNIDEGNDTEDILGDENEERFSFDQMGEYNVEIEVLGGNVQGHSGPAVTQWWDWMAQEL